MMLGTFPDLGKVTSPEDGLTPWLPRDFSQRSSTLIQPSFWCRKDGYHLVYPGKVHWFIGPSESCKTWAAMMMVAQALALYQSVLYIDYEDDLTTFCLRLSALGVDVDNLPPGLLTYIDATAPLFDKYGERTEYYPGFFHTVLSGTYDLVVMDGVTNAFLVEGLDPMSNSDAALFLARLPQAIATATGAAVNCLDHMAKNVENGTRWAIGAQHKIAGVNGAAFSFELLKPFARTGPGLDSHLGLVGIHVAKDRPGFVRALTNGSDLVAHLELTSWADGGVTAHLLPPPSYVEQKVVDERMAGEIVNYLAIYEGATWSAIRSAVKGKDARKQEALTWLIAEGYVLVQKQGQTHRHSATDKGLEGDWKK